MKNKIKKIGFIDSLQDILDDYRRRIILLEIMVMNNRKMIEGEAKDRGKEIIAKKKRRFYDSSLRGVKLLKVKEKR